MKKTIYQFFNPDNEFFLLAKDAKRLPHISLSSFILPVVFILSASLIAGYLIAPLIIGDSTDLATWVRQVLGLYGMFGMGIIIIFLWVKFFEERAISTLGFAKRGVLKDYFSGFGFGFLMVTIVVGVIALFGNVQFVEDSPNITGIDSLVIVLIFLGGFIIQGAFAR